MTYIDEIKSLLQTHGAPELARLLNTTERAVMYWIAEKGAKKPRKGTVQKIHELFKGNEQSPPIAGSPSKSTGDIIFNMSESSKEHALADRIRAEAEILREQNNKKLIDLLSSERGGEESPLTVQTILPGLQELLIDLGLKKLWDSREQAETILNKRLFGHSEKKPSKGIRDGSGKPHK